MKSLIVIFELTNPELKLEKIRQKIAKYSMWAKLSNYAYLVVTNSTVVEVRDDLMRELTAGDRLYVAPCPVPAAWVGLPEDVAKWILENQPKYS